MCILLKLPYAKFDISRLFCSKVMEEKPLGDRLDSPPPPPLVKEGLSLLVAVHGQHATSEEEGRM